MSSGCRFPQHHASGAGGVPVVLVLAVLAAAVAAYWAVRLAVEFVVANAAWFIGVPAAAVIVMIFLTVVRLARGWRPVVSRYWLAARWHRFRWPRLARNLRLARADEHKPGTVNLPRARFRAGAHGWVTHVRLVDGVGRDHFEKNADLLADSWRCARVGISSPRPGRLQVRAMRRDPLTEPLDGGILRPFDGRRVVLGRDQWGAVRDADLANLSGSLIAGNPGRGKSESASSLAVQLVPSPLVETYILDGGGGLDWSLFDGRVHRYATELPDVLDALEDVNARMVMRRRTLLEDLGVRNAWHVGPSPGYPLIWVLVDEAQAFLDLSGAKGTPREKQVQACQGLVAELVRRGRAPMVHTTILTQKPTSTSLPTMIRDLCGLRWCFGVATLEAAIAALGDDIRPLESMHPTKLQSPDHVGIATALLTTGADTYTQLKFPRIGDELVRQAAAVIHPVASPAPAVAAIV
jgi:S-DNA-T family DNA segregation ATPase FtsK/SpoIIIE